MRMSQYLSNSWSALLEKTSRATTFTSSTPPPEFDPKSCSTNWLFQTDIFVLTFGSLALCFWSNRNEQTKGRCQRNLIANVDLSRGFPVSQSEATSSEGICVISKLLWLEKRSRTPNGEKSSLSPLPSLSLYAPKWYTIFWFGGKIKSRSPLGFLRISFLPPYPHSSPSHTPSSCSLMINFDLPFVA